MRSLRLGIFAFAVMLTDLATAGEPQYALRYLQEESGQRTLLSQGWEQGRKSSDDQSVSVTAVPDMVIEHKELSKGRIVKVTSASEARVRSYLSDKSITLDEPLGDPSIHDEVVTLVNNGPSANRIDLVFMGDGYTNSEREKFFSDIRHLVEQLFVYDTFKSYLPIFNVHAVFRASAESGIGRILPKRTAYKLFRDGNTLRSIYPGNKPAIRASCHQAPGCDYPIVIANDPYYGGLGGEFAISTSSPESGIIVLRHELGHQVGEIGEEYDGGGYFGANHADSLAEVTWNHWLSGPLVAEPIVARYISWPWLNLSSGPVNLNFSSDGRQSSYLIRLSASGMQHDDDIQLSLDGEPIALQSPHTTDRVFFNVSREQGFGAGAHRLTVSEGERDGDNWLSSVTVHEYGRNFHADDNYIGAYPVFKSVGRSEGYRPTNEACLMRNMQSEQFCSICKENNWLKFFHKIGMIDSLSIDRTVTPNVVRLLTPHLGQLRSEPIIGEEIEVHWLRDGVEVPELRGLFEWPIATADQGHVWQADVIYHTPEVRVDSLGLLHKRSGITL